MSRHFVLQGGRSLSHAALLRLLELGHVIVWARPGQEPVVVLTAGEYEKLSGHSIAETTFAPSRFCRLCTRFTGGRACAVCDPPSSEFVTRARNRRDRRSEKHRKAGRRFRGGKRTSR